MRKSICIILLAGMFMVAISILAQRGTEAQAEEKKYTSPTGERATLGSGRIYLMYDLETSALCYVTSMGGISCTHRGNLGFPDRFHEITKKAREEYKERNHTAPHMILLNVEPKPKEIRDTNLKQKDDNL